MEKELVKVEPQEMDIVTRYALSKVNPNVRTAKKNAEMRRSVVRGFLEFAGRPPEEVTPEDVEAFKSHLEATGYEASTIYHRISIISTFFEYLLDKKLIRFNPVPKGKWRNGFRPKPYSSEKVKTLSREEVNTFLEAIDRERVQGARLYAMCLVMLTTGMRASEVCGILWKNTKLSNGVPTVRTRVKGGEFVTFELVPEAVEAIKAYLRIAQRRPRGPHALFAPVTKRKKGGRRYQPLDPYYLWSQIKRLGEKVGLDISPHTFRHTFAQAYHEAGASEPEVQGALGHRSGETTRVYLSRLAPRSRKAGKAVQRWLTGLDEG